MYDLAIVGSGIVGLAHAVMAVRRGLRPVVIDRHAAPIGASIRNFGFVTVTGQGAGGTWQRALRSRDIWLEVAPEAGIEILQRGLLVTAQRPEAMTVLEAFCGHEMGRDCRLLTADAVRADYTGVGSALQGGLYSPHDLRVNSRTAIPRLVQWLANRGVTFRFDTAALTIEGTEVVTPQERLRAGAVVVCPGDDLSGLYPDIYARHAVMRSQLHMMRLSSPGFDIGCPRMSDLSLVRYRGYAELKESEALAGVLAREQSQHLEAGIHLIVTQGADGSLIVGDSHHYGRAPEPFYDAAVEGLILDEFKHVLGIDPPPVIERWLGTYASAADDLMSVSPDERVRLVVVTSGTGASTSFGIAEETLNDLFGMEPPYDR
ncbi:TIGR03364 family FAD-dependent oxidoreductase [Asticcacaulis sp. ZE23SCel15]|uniref:TIGR03364 family FAD-dependent oxidoreductase n=1 Tax=Asticcacaulis sp. ZE23SCel15 TaxID=3059027 RepID=UPI00265F03A3|nr:TIGR03364 family FAD-dependent oxidoreductase [Asticcacaulis sp. ZE23SCel15]WKL58940.1 TIGR03364 family FAD-dependent oxidoreductase [Asticcacaulis sp. ZE23SCel15]